VKIKKASQWWQKWELGGKLLCPPPFLFFAFFLIEKYDNDVTGIFFCLFFNITPLYPSWGNDGTNFINFPSDNSISTYSSKTYCCKIEVGEL